MLCPTASSIMSVVIGGLLAVRACACVACVLERPVIWSALCFDVVWLCLSLSISLGHDGAISLVLVFRGSEVVDVLCRCDVDN
jgi:hypothetical protein